MPDLAEHLKQLERYYFNKPINAAAVQLLGGGFSPAKNYRIEDDGKTYFARFMPIETNALSLASCEREALITEYAGKIGIGAKVYYQNLEQGILITEFIQGRAANFDDMVNDPNRSLIIANINKLHQTAPLAFPKAPTVAEHIQSTLKRANSTILQQQLDALELMAPLHSLFHVEKNNLTPTFIHGDVNPNNILINKNRVYFIDWSDAGIGDPFADISWHALFFPWSLHDKLLGYYFDHSDTFVRQKLICYYCLRLYKFIAWGVELAKNISPRSEYLLLDIMQQQNLPEPYDIIVDSFSNKITYNDPNNFLLVAATMLHFLAQFTKTDTFLSAIERLNRHV